MKTGLNAIKRGLLNPHNCVSCLASVSPLLSPLPNHSPSSALLTTGSLTSVKVIKHTTQWKKITLVHTQTHTQHAQGTSPVPCDISKKGNTQLGRASSVESPSSPGDNGHEHFLNPFHMLRTAGHADWAQNQPHMDIRS